MIKVVVIAGVAVLIGLVALVYYLLRPLAHKPVPARFHCYDIAQGSTWHSIRRRKPSA